MAAGGQNPHRWIFPPKAAPKSAPGGSWCSKRGVGVGGSSLERPPHGSLAPIEPKSARFWFRKPKSRPVPTLPNKEGVIEPTPPDPFQPGGGASAKPPPHLQLPGGVQEPELDVALPRGDKKPLLGESHRCHPAGHLVGRHQGPLLLGENHGAVSGTPKKKKTKNQKSEQPGEKTASPLILGEFRGIPRVPSSPRR